MPVDTRLELLKVVVHGKERGWKRVPVLRSYREKQIGECVHVCMCVCFVRFLFNLKPPERYTQTICYFFNFTAKGC